MKNEKSKIETFFVVDRNEIIIEMNEMYVNLKKGENIGRNKGQVWKGRKDDGDEKKEVCSIEDHRSRIRSLLSILGCK